MLHIELRHDFRIPDQEQDQQLMMAFPDNKYLGEGRYNLSLSEIVGLYVKIDSKETRDAALASLPSLSKAVVPEVKPK